MSDHLASTAVQDPATVIKTVWYWHKNRHRPMGQNQMPGNKSMCGQLIFDKGAKNTQWGMGDLFDK